MEGKIAPVSLPELLSVDKDDRERVAVLSATPSPFSCGRKLFRISASSLALYPFRLFFLATGGPTLVPGGDFKTPLAVEAVVSGLGACCRATTPLVVLVDAEVCMREEVFMGAG
jgi:hypothetical protein